MPDRYPTLLLVLFGWILSALLGAPARAELRPLFEGDLSQWDTWLARPAVAPPDAPSLGLNVDPRGVFSIVEVAGRPALRISGEYLGGLTSKREFSNFRLRLSYRWGELRWLAPERPRNSGLIYHGHGDHGSGAAGAFLTGHELQMMAGNAGDYIALGAVAATVKTVPHDERGWAYEPTGEPRDFHPGSPVGRRVIKASAAEHPEGEWNTLELVCWEDGAAHYVNGRLVLVLTASRRLGADGSTAPLPGGRLQIQTEGAELFVRDIGWEPLTERPPELGEL
jgi:hypothetical protein